MTGESYDLIVIGGGPAGQKAAIQGAKAGRSVLLVDKQRAQGGECVTRGTIPSKTLRETAVWLSGLNQHAPRLFDTRLSPDQSVESLMRRLDDVRGAHDAFLRNQLDRNGIVRWRGKARFTGTHELAVDVPGREARTATAQNFLIAPGTRPRTPDNVPVDHEHVLDSDSILSMIYLPTSLVVLGAGVIACEFASIFAALGVRVTIVDKGERPLGFVDADLVERFVEDFVERGGTFLPRRKLEHVAVEENGVATYLEGGEVLHSEKVLCALGRVASVRGLGLEHLGIELTPRGLVPVDEHGRTSAPHVYAAGDVIGPPALAAASMEQGRRAVRHMLGLGDPDVVSLLPTGIYTIPEMAAVGLTEEQAVEQHGSALVGSASFGELARGHISGDTRGMLKLVCDPGGSTILGAHIVGRGATDLIHVAQMAMVGGLSPQAFVDNTFNFPTMAEAYRVAAFEVVQAAPADLRRVG